MGAEQAGSSGISWFGRADFGHSVVAAGRRNVGRRRRSAGTQEVGVVVRRGIVLDRWLGRRGEPGGDWRLAEKRLRHGDLLRLSLRAEPPSRQELFPTGLIERMRRII